MIDAQVGAAVAIAVAAAGFAAASSDQIDYSGTVNLGTALILLALGAVTIYNRHRGDSTRMLRESRDDWEKRAKELAAENDELRKRPDMDQLIDLVKTQAEGGTAMAQTILEQLKTTGDQIGHLAAIFQEHDRKLVERTDRLADIVESREQRFRRSDT